MFRPKCRYVKGHTRTNDPAAAVRWRFGAVLAQEVLARSGVDGQYASPSIPRPVYFTGVSAATGVVPAAA